MTNQREERDIERQLAAARALPSGNSAALNYPGLRLIGVAGLKRSGKSTVSDVLASRGFAEVAFAGPLKEGVAKMLRISAADLETYKEIAHPVYGFPMRLVLQQIGTEVMRWLCPGVWQLVADRVIAEHYKHGRAVVISDVRFEDEAAFIRALGGVVIHVERFPRPAWWRRLFVHASERGVRIDPRRDGVILNNGCEIELRETVRALDGVAGADWRNELIGWSYNALLGTRKRISL